MTVKVRRILVAGAGVLLGAPIALHAECVVDGNALARQLVLPEGTGYRELTIAERGADEFAALVTCDSCRSTISVVHPRVAAGDVPMFPRPDTASASKRKA